jgi:H+-translocating diphosphatase
MFESDNY